MKGLSPHLCPKKEKNFISEIKNLVLIVYCICIQVTNHYFWIDVDKMSVMSLTLIHWPMLDVVTFIIIYGTSIVQFRWSSERSFFPYLDIHLSESDYRKRKKTVVQDLGSIQRLLIGWWQIWTRVCGQLLERGWFKWTKWWEKCGIRHQRVDILIIYLFIYNWNVCMNEEKRISISFKLYILQVHEAKSNM